jgi:GNAT superfamily N-acetyltransferase
MRRYVVYELDPSKIDPRQQVGTEIDLQRCESEASVQAVEALTYFKRVYSTGPCLAYQATIENKILGGMWAATEAFDENELGVRLLLTEKQAWLFAALVSKQARGQGVYGQLLPFVIDDQRQRGHDQILVSVNPDNLRSNRIHLRWAKRTVGYVTAIRLLRIGFCHVSGDIEKSSTVGWVTPTNPILLNIKPPQSAR